MRLKRSTGPRLSPMRGRGRGGLLASGHQVRRGHLPGPAQKRPCHEDRACRQSAAWLLRGVHGAGAVRGPRDPKHFFGEVDRALDRAKRQGHTAMEIARFRDRRNSPCGIWRVRRNHNLPGPQTLVQTASASRRPCRARRPDPAWSKNTKHLLEPNVQLCVRDVSRVFKLSGQSVAYGGIQSDVRIDDR